MAEPLPPAPEDPAPEPGTARALWPTFMRRTLPVEDVEEAAPEPRRPDGEEPETKLNV
ncbi:hypothetical protein [Plastoroseomonas arctica]|uniref:Uncharacterized protein n=1 Tax=Plastoroseomonas arctica TaxID=1509237 RepID=A0AAF1KUT8_9PROT|nr:hypothetical protein [Plastoroseomonas arctica]MBR0657027.1 hypothetical protein [Plastoroseomonas arctica]